MFPTVSNATGSSFPAQPTGQYVVKLVRCEDGGISKFSDKEQVRFVFHVANARGVITNQDGQPAELHAYTNKTLAMKSKARAWLEPLLGRELIEGEDGSAVVTEATGQKANAFIEQKPNQMGEPRSYIKAMWAVGGTMPTIEASAADDDGVVPF